MRILIFVDEKLPRSYQVSSEISERAMLAFYETVRSGLIKVKVLKVEKDASGSTRITARVTGRDRTYPYACGDLIEVGATHMIPRHAVRKFRSSYFPKILPYSWDGVAV